MGALRGCLLAAAVVFPAVWIAPATSAGVGQIPEGCYLATVAAGPQRLVKTMALELAGKTKVTSARLTVIFFDFPESFWIEGACAAKSAKLECAMVDGNGDLLVELSGAEIALEILSPVSVERNATDGEGGYRTIEGDADRFFILRSAESEACKI